MTGYLSTDSLYHQETRIQRPHYCAMFPGYMTTRIRRANASNFSIVQLRRSSVFIVICCFINPAPTGAGVSPLISCYKHEALTVPENAPGVLFSPNLDAFALPGSGILNFFKIEPINSPCENTDHRRRGRTLR